MIRKNSVRGSSKATKRRNNQLVGAWCSEWLGFRCGRSCASKKRWATGTLTFSDIGKHSDYSANNFGLGDVFHDQQWQ